MCINSTQTLDFSVGRLQIDDQMKDCYFPVVMAPTVLPKGIQKIFLHCAASIIKDDKVPVLMFENCSFWMQELDAAIHEYMLVRLLECFEGLWTANPDDSDLLDRSIAIRKFVTELEVPSYLKSSPSLIYFRTLNLGPVATNISFRTSTAVRGSNPVSSSSGSFAVGVLQTLLSSFVASAGNLQNYPIRLNAKIISNVTGDAYTLTWTLFQYYQNEIIRQLLGAVFGGNELFGNPRGLISNLGDGMSDFFMEPAQGLLKSPSEFGLGVVKGSSSLLLNSVEGVFGSVANVTSAVADFGAVLSMDETYLVKRTRRTTSLGPSHLGHGLSQGARSVAIGVTEGVQGVFLDPFKGARKNGGKGFLKGVAKGLVGLVVKPSVGVIDGVSQTIKGMRNSALHFMSEDHVHNKRVRICRRIGPNGALLFTESASEDQQKRP